MSEKSTRQRTRRTTKRLPLEGDIEQAPTHLATKAKQTEPSVVPYDETLLERTRVQWQFGDWESLVKLGRTTLQHHPDRAKLALLTAAAHLQMGNSDAGRQFIRLAQDWGCGERLVSQILIAGVHNTLGRVHTVAGRQPRATAHFERAIAVGRLGSEVRLIGRARMGQQLEQLGLVPGTNGRLQAIKSGASARLRGDAQSTTAKAPNPTFSPDAYSFYQGISRFAKKKGSAPFILIDCKSLPRSGLHYMRNTFAKLLEERFSFCEWYQEAGCCKQMPCALTGFAEQCKKTKTARLRLVKSHDFDLTDPVYAPLYSVRRVIIVRDPLFILTSWFALDQLKAYKSELHKYGIRMEKIWLSHEPEVLASAFQVLDAEFVPVGANDLTEWLVEKSAYISGFIEKWVRPANETPQPFLNVVLYEEIDSFVASILAELRDYISDAANERIDLIPNRHGFRARQDPFRAPSKKLTAYLAENANEFREIASRIQLQGV